MVKNLMKGVNVSLIKRKIQEKKSCWSTGPVLNSLRFNPEQTQLHSSVLNIKMTFISFTDKLSTVHTRFADDPEGSFQQQ